MISKRPSGAITSRNVAIIGAILGASLKAGSTIENSGVGAANIASLARPSGHLWHHYGAPWAPPQRQVRLLLGGLLLGRPLPIRFLLRRLCSVDFVLSTWRMPSAKDRYRAAIAP